MFFHAGKVYDGTVHSVVFALPVAQWGRSKGMSTVDLQRPQESKQSKPSEDSRRLGMIADDLTGACDTGAQYVRHGFRAVVLLDTAANVFIEDTDLLVLSTDSRNTPPDEAHRKTQRAWLALEQHRARLFYKKIDSTLRGNLGAEITAVLAAGGHQFAVVTPAFPAMGRRLLEGRLQVEGSTEFEALHLPTLLAEQGLLHVAHLGLPEVRSGPALLHERFEWHRRKGAEVIVADAVSDDDLVCITEAALQCTPVPLLVGSAGLGAHVAAHPTLYRDASRAFSQPASSARGSVAPVLLVVGSKSQTTRAQVAALAANIALEIVPLDTEARAKTEAALRAGKHVLIPLRWEGVEEENRLRAVLALLSQVSVSGLILSGGDTAAQVCGLLGAWGLRLEGEVETGLPWGRLLGGEGEGIPVCTKAGAFGKEGALITAVHFLQSQAQESAP